MKNWHILTAFLFGVMITIIGALFKIMHWEGAAMMLIVGMGLKALAILLLIVKVVQMRKTNELLNK